MIYEKSIALPALKARSVTRKLALYSEEDGAIYCRGEQFRPTDGGLVMAEGSEYVCDLPIDCTGLRLSGGHAQQAFFVHMTGTLTRMSDKKVFLTHKPNCVLSYRAQDGQEKIVCITDYEVYFHDGDYGTLLKGMEGGKTGCLAYERLFTAKDEFIRWSNPLEPQNFSKSISGAGYATIPSPEGNILQMVPFKDDLLLLRERGMTVLKVKGEPLEYAAENYFCMYGKVVDKTLQICGDKAIFLTEGGLCSFDGSHLNRIAGCGFEELDLSYEYHNSASVKGIYYAAVRTKRGNNRLWAVDPETERGHFICITSSLIIGGDELLFAESGKLYRMTPKGLPYRGESAKLICERSYFGLSDSRKFLDGVSFEGEGFLSLEAISECGRSQRVSGWAGERLRFPVPLRGTAFAFHIDTVCESVKLRGLKIELREESESW